MQRPLIMRSLSRARTQGKLAYRSIPTALISLVLGTHANFPCFTLIDSTKHGKEALQTRSSSTPRQQRYFFTPPMNLLVHLPRNSDPGILLTGGADLFPRNSLPRLEALRSDLRSTSLLPNRKLKNGTASTSSLEVAASARDRGKWREGRHQM